MKKLLAVLLTLVMALSVCVPAFAAPSLPDPNEIIGGIKDKVDAEITNKINATYVVLEGYIAEHQLTEKPSEPVIPQKPVKPAKPEILVKYPDAPELDDFLLYGDANDQYQYYKDQQLRADWDEQNAIYEAQTARYDIALQEYEDALKSYDTAKATYDARYQKWEDECAEWAKNLIQGQGMTHEAAKVAVTVMYNKGTFSKAELSYAKEALRKVTSVLASHEKSLAIAKIELAQNRAQLDKVLKDRISATEVNDALEDKYTYLDSLVQENNDTVLTETQAIQNYTELSAKAKALSKNLSETYALTTSELDTLDEALTVLEDSFSAEEKQDQFAKSQIAAVRNIVTVQREQINKAQYDAIMKAIDAKDMYVSPAPQVSVDHNIYKLVVEAKDGKAVTDALTALKVPVKFMNTYIDKIVASKFILESVGKLGKDQVAKLGDANAEDTTNPDGTNPGTPNEDKPASGIGGLISSLLDKLKGNKGDNNKGEVDNSENGNGPATGDVAIYSVLGLAAVAGTAVVLTKKKKDVK